MKATILKPVLFVGVLLTIFSFTLPMPEGWFKAGSLPDSYDMGVVKGTGADSTKKIATIKSIDKHINGFGTLMQNCGPTKFLGKRVRMSGYMKSEGVKKWASFWLRIDQKNTLRPLSFDNMYNGVKDRSIKGTTDWTKYEIVLDVPEEASNMAYGALIEGTGQIWFKDLKFEVVDASVPLTGTERTALKTTTYEEPSNLDFSK